MANTNTRPYIIELIEKIYAKISSDTASILSALNTNNSTITELRSKSVSNTVWTNARADLIDQIAANSSNTKTTVETMNGTINSININTKSSADYTNALHSRLTVARANNLDLLANDNYGLSAIKSVLNNVNTLSTTLSSRVTEARASNLDMINNSIYGLPAIKNAIGTGSIIKSIQKVSSSSGKQSSTSHTWITVTIAAINPDKSIIIISGNHDGLDCMAKISSATTIQVFTNCGHNVIQIIEFV